MSDRRVVITGLGPISPIGVGKDAFWTSLQAGTVGVDTISRFDAGSFRTQIAGEIRDFKCSNYVPRSYRKSIKVMARDIELAVAAADEAVRDAGLVTKAVDENNPQVDPLRMGVNIGAGLICADLVELAGALSSAVDGNGRFSLARWGAEGMNNLTPLWLLKYLPNMLACHVTIIHDAQAPSNTITCAEASSQLAIGEAFRTIARGAADVCLCGGAESKINPMGLLRQSLLGRLTESCNDTPAEAVKPFDKDRDGTVVGEGGGVIVLEAEEHALARNAGRIYGELIGFGASFDPNGLVAPEEDGKAVATAVNKALKDASMTAGEVDLVAAFGAGLEEHDLSEASALSAVFGDRPVPILAIKGQMGCCGAGAGALDLIAGLLAMENGFVPASVNCRTVDPRCKLNVVRQGGEQTVNVLLAVSYSLVGGQVAALVVRKYQ